MLLGMAACRDVKKEAAAFENAVLGREALARDTSLDSLLGRTLEGINCIAGAYLGKKLVFADAFDPKDTTHILLIPYSPLGDELKSAAYSNVEGRYILLQPRQVKSFTRINALNPDTGLEGTLSLVLLHELGHFKLNKEGAFDRPAPYNTALGEMRMNTRPEYLTALKRVELSADSVAVALVKQAARARDRSLAACFSAATDVQLALPGMEFQVFGTRLIGDFGGPSILRDPNSTHPNLELRLAFMNYFLNPTLEKKQMIDHYLYDREVAPVHRQEFDPRIFQGIEKRLP